MANDCSVTVTGNITRDVEMREAGNSTVANTAIAYNRRYNSQGEWREETSYFDITAWGELAENASASLNKRDRVTVTGYLKQETCGDEDNRRSKIVIVADDIAPSLRWATTDITKSKGGNAPSSASSSNTDEEPF